MTDDLELVCGICLTEDLTEIGELDSCRHLFCFPCISRWAEIESKCPFCKLRFSQLRHKRLAGREDLAHADPSGPLPGTYLDVQQVPERNQRVVFEDPDFQQWIEEVVCIICGGGHDEDQLLLCDGCDRACHTYCAGVDGIPEGEWFCPQCQEAQEAAAAAERRGRRQRQRPQQALAQQRRPAMNGAQGAATGRRRGRGPQQPSVVIVLDSSEEDDLEEEEQARPAQRRRTGQLERQRPGPAPRQRSGSRRVSSEDDDLEDFIVRGSEEEDGDADWSARGRGRGGGRATANQRSSGQQRAAGAARAAAPRGGSGRGQAASQGRLGGSQALQRARGALPESEPEFELSDSEEEEWISEAGEEGEEGLEDDSPAAAARRPRRRQQAVHAVQRPPRQQQPQQQRRRQRSGRAGGTGSGDPAAGARAGSRRGQVLSSSEDGEILAGGDGEGSRQQGEDQSDEDLPLMQRLEARARRSWGQAGAAGPARTAGAAARQRTQRGSQAGAAGLAAAAPSRGALAGFSSLAGQGLHVDSLRFNWDALRRGAASFQSLGDAAPAPSGGRRRLVRAAELADPARDQHEQQRPVGDGPGLESDPIRRAAAAAVARAAAGGSVPLVDLTSPSPGPVGAAAASARGQAGGRAAVYALPGGVEEQAWAALAQAQALQEERQQQQQQGRKSERPRRGARRQVLDSDAEDADVSAADESLASRLRRQLAEAKDKGSRLVPRQHGAQAAAQGPTAAAAGRTAGEEVEGPGVTPGGGLERHPDGAGGAAGSAGAPGPSPPTTGRRLARTISDMRFAANVARGTPFSRGAAGAGAGAPQQRQRGPAAPFVIPRRTPGNAPAERDGLGAAGERAGAHTLHNNGSHHQQERWEQESLQQRQERHISEGENWPQAGSTPWHDSRPAPQRQQQQPQQQQQEGPMQEPLLPDKAANTARDPAAANLFSRFSLQPRNGVQHSQQRQQGQPPARETGTGLPGTSQAIQLSRQGHFPLAQAAGPSQPAHASSMGFGAVHPGQQRHQQQSHTVPLHQPGHPPSDHVQPCPAQPNGLSPGLPLADWQGFSQPQGWPDVTPPPGPLRPTVIPSSTPVMLQPQQGIAGRFLSANPDVSPAKKAALHVSNGSGDRSHGEPAISAGASGASLQSPSKAAVHEKVKVHLKGPYKQGQLSREQYKQVGREVTHQLHSRGTTDDAAVEAAVREAVLRVLV
ncbi:hypothetical protein N2152v2_010554 [Parachlorella kessleri]